jgi:circadian clock protein KaiB
VTYLLRLYVTGRTASSMRAINNLRNICSVELQGDAKVDVIDVLTQPELAEQDRILATPTLVKRLPTPTCRIIGDLSDRASALHGLEIDGFSLPQNNSFALERTQE